MSEMLSSMKIMVIGAGMAGSEAAYFLAQRGLKVVLLESKRVEKNPAQKSSHFAELVCTNSLKSLKEQTPHGLLKLEMLKMGSLILECATQAKVPAGDALAVDRERFSRLVSEKLESHPNIEVINQIVDNPLEMMKQWGCDYVIVATGPLTHQGLERWIQEKTSKDDFYFYDAIAPVVDADSLDTSKMFYQDRHQKIEQCGDYLNIPLNQQQYYDFVEDLVAAQKVSPKNFEQEKFFEACLPIDLMAQRGPETLRFSCMKPIGLTPKDGQAPFAVIQLRKENLLGSAFNIVGFQNRLTYPEQQRVFRKLPGMQDASFIHLGSVHRNSFLNARKHLHYDMSLKQDERIFFAGQITGVEGYTESASSGLYVAWQLWRRLKAQASCLWPVETAIGALINYLMSTPKPRPSNINFGLLPSVELTKSQRKDKDRKKIKKQLVVHRAQEVFARFIHENPVR